MVEKAATTDSVRDSRDGHEFHEMWTARRALALLMPDCDIAGIAVEGLSTEDESASSKTTAEVADITVYYGSETSFQHAKSIEIIQFKHAGARDGNEFYASDTRKTMEKFAVTFKEYNGRFSPRTIDKKLRFELLTNRRLSDSLVKALSALAVGDVVSGDVKRQATTLKGYTGLEGDELKRFFRLCRVTGSTLNLTQTKQRLSNQIVDWSVSDYTKATASMGNLSRLVRDKAGGVGAGGHHIIKRADILSVFDVSDPLELVPCTPALVKVEQVIERAQHAEALALLVTAGSPLIVHAEGGIGKTVFLESLAKDIERTHHVVFFDCFGGGAYRKREDSRHLPRFGLLHIVNTLAFEGLCDPIIPGSNDTVTLLRTFRRRIQQCVTSLRRTKPDRQLILFIDALDNARGQADLRREESFPELLLESFSSEPIDGFKLVGACRSHRRPLGHEKYDQIQLKPFTHVETARFLRDRLQDVTDNEIATAFARTKGVARMLEYLLQRGRALLDPIHRDENLDLDDLIDDQIRSAVDAAALQGHDHQTIAAFLGGLAVLPPPVPVDEYAEAFGFSVGAVESFVSDLGHLLEHSTHGVMFRDEPAETYIGEHFAATKSQLRPVVDNLDARQEQSAYAARALPDLLQKLGDGARLFSLAFDQRFPKTVTSIVGQRNIRYARLKAAALHTALTRDHDRLVRVLTELSTVAAVEQSGTGYLLDFPDLVASVGDPDAMRRLVEARTEWPGKRHARLSIANLLSDDHPECARHAFLAEEWIVHFRENYLRERASDSGPERLDVASVILYLIGSGRSNDAADYFRSWKDWYGFELCQNVFPVAEFLESQTNQPIDNLRTFVDGLSTVGALAGALAFKDHPLRIRKKIVVKLARAAAREAKLEVPDAHQADPGVITLLDGLRKSAAQALALGLHESARYICRRIPRGRVGLWYFRDRFPDRRISGYILGHALSAAAHGREIHERDLLPSELVPICKKIPRTIGGEEFRKRAHQALQSYPRKSCSDEGGNVKGITSDTKEAGERFLSRLDWIMAVTRSVVNVLSSPRGSANRLYKHFFRVSEDARVKNRGYQHGPYDPMFNHLTKDLLLFCFWSRDDLSVTSARRLLARLAENDHQNRDDLIWLVSILARRSYRYHELAGEVAIEATKRIEIDNSVRERARSYGALARAILPASFDEARGYFFSGLEQLDAIGSEDYRFVSELLVFASKNRGGELPPQDFHTLSNICELNLDYDAEKFPWGTFGSALASVSGARGLAKIARWDDRSVIPLSNTLVPYLTSLVEHEKIDPSLAVCLNELADPVEYYDEYRASTKYLARAVVDKAGNDAPTLLVELIRQYLRNNPKIPHGSALDSFSNLAVEHLPENDRVRKRVKQLIRARDNHEPRERRSASLDIFAKGVEPNLRDAVVNVALQADPTTSDGLEKAVSDFNSIKNVWGLRGLFFDLLRKRVPFVKRTQYAKDIASLEGLNLYEKLEELKSLRKSWSSSLKHSDTLFASIGKPLLFAHANEFVTDDYTNSRKLIEISELTGLELVDVVTDLITLYSRPDTSIAGRVWLGLSTLICPSVKGKTIRIALSTLLRSSSAQLADNVLDGPYEESLYPRGTIARTAAALIWRVLGATYTEDRWRAAHAVRMLVRLGHKKVLRSLIQHFDDTGAGAFQAKELQFSFFNARLWLLIAIARIAKDTPEAISPYKSILLRVAEEDTHPHVLQQHFAARALLKCEESGVIRLSAPQKERLQATDCSPHPRLTQRIRTGGGYYDPRPKSSPKPRHRIYLDMDFEKHDVQELSRVFGQPGWKVSDMISAISHSIAPDVTSMNDPGGRELRCDRDDAYGMSSRYQTFAQHLAWNALHLSAGRLLRDLPVTQDAYYGGDTNPWNDYLAAYLLTRKDGYWLSDGVDWYQLDIHRRLLIPTNDKEEAITGDHRTLLALLGIKDRVSKMLTVDGRWFSPDGVRVKISSSLVAPGMVEARANSLNRQDPFNVWLPSFTESHWSPEHQQSRKVGHQAWIVNPDYSLRLDENDPFGGPSAINRSRIESRIAKEQGLTADDPFGRIWRKTSGTVALQAEAWGVRNDDGNQSRLKVSSTLIKKILADYKKHLLILIDLQRYQKGSTYRDSRYHHTIAVVSVDENLEYAFFPGMINQLHRSKW
ncbi:MAG: ATP-binding protein [Pseudomonadota bacterium]